jgi:predicted transcriptional regulator
MAKKQIKQYERLADAELDIMRVLWQTREAMRAAQIVKQLSETRSWKTQTAHVLLGRLEEKGFVKADRSEYFHTYRAAVTEKAYFASESDAFVRRLGSSVKATVASLINASDISAEELSELEELIRAKRFEEGK